MDNEMSMYSKLDTKDYSGTRDIKGFIYSSSLSNALRVVCL